MPRRIAQSTLNGTTVDIINVIRQNASFAYQSNVPEIENATQIPQVGEIICGTPAFANEYLNALVNRIALVQVKSATFNNPYKRLKKGLLSFGETVEEIFVDIAKVQKYDVEKAKAREFARNIPQAHTAFHAQNWQVQYPVTVQKQDLRKAFLSEDGMLDLISRIVSSTDRASEYDEFLLTKYLIIKGVTKGHVYPVSIGDGTNMNLAAESFRGISNVLPFMSSDYNYAGVKTNTPKDRQVIIMDAMYNAKYDVEVLASAFNMDKADFMGSLYLIDSFETFDNDRFAEIRAESDAIEEVTADELALMANVKAVLLDEDFFQIYDNLIEFTETPVNSGLYWNYWLHNWKTISFSPFANAVVFATDGATITAPASVTVKIASKDVSDIATVYTLEVAEPTSIASSAYQFIQTEQATTNGIAIQRYGAVIFPAGQETTTLEMKFSGADYVASSALTVDSEVGSTITFEKQ